MRKLATTLLATAVFALAACGGGGNKSGDGHTVEMQNSSFVQSSVTIKAGESVKFTDSSASHILATGQNSAFQQEPGAPAQLSTATGLTFNPGDTREITFPTAGTYHIYCIIHPGMQVTINVK